MSEIDVDIFLLETALYDARKETDEAIQAVNDNMRPAAKLFFDMMLDMSKAQANSYRAGYLGDSL